MTIAALLMLAFTADDAVPSSKPIFVGEIQARIAIAKVGRIPLVDFTGEIVQSKDECFMLVIRLDNGSSTKRVDFSGWPEPGAFRMNFSVSDEFGNRYKPVTFGFTTKKAEDESGETIEPQGKRVAIVVFEKPIPLANTLTVDLDGSAVGQSGKRLKWTIKREDWEKKQ